MRPSERPPWRSTRRRGQTVCAVPCCHTLVCTHPARSWYLRAALVHARATGEKGWSLARRLASRATWPPGEKGLKTGHFCQVGGGCAVQVKVGATPAGGRGNLFRKNSGSHLDCGWEPLLIFLLADQVVRTLQPVEEEDSVQGSDSYWKSRVIKSVNTLDFATGRGSGRAHGIQRWRRLSPRRPAILKQPSRPLAIPSERSMISLQIPLSPCLSLHQPPRPRSAVSGSARSGSLRTNSTTSASSNSTTHLVVRKDGLQHVARRSAWPGSRKGSAAACPGRRRVRGRRRGWPSRPPGRTRSRCDHRGRPGPSPQVDRRHLSAGTLPRSTTSPTTAAHTGCRAGH